MEPTDDDINNDEKSTYSTSISLSGGDHSSEWNQIGTIEEINEKIDAIRSLREYTQSELKQNNDGGFSKQDDVLFFSKIDKQYIPGFVKDKKKDKLTKDIVYKLSKTHKRDPDVEEELGAKKRSAKEDPRVEIIKFREQRAKKPATMTWNVKETQTSYYKIMSVNDYQIELQLSVLKILKKKVETVIKKRKRLRKLTDKASNIEGKMKKSKQKRDRKQRVAATFSGTRQQMLSLSKHTVKTLSPKAGDNGNKRSPRSKQSSKHVKHSMSVSMASVVSDLSEDNSNTPVFYVNKPEGDPKTWSEEDVLTWLQYISQNESIYEMDKNLSEEERKNYKKARKGLLDNYMDKFINADIDGKALAKLDNVTLRSKVYMNAGMDRKVVVKCLEDLFGKQNEFVKASHYEGSNYDFSKDWKKSMRAEIEFQKRKLAAGDLSKMRVTDIGRSKYKGTEWTQEMSDAAGGGIYEDKVNKHSKQSSFLLRKKKAGMKRHKTVAEIGTNKNYVIPDYADQAIADTMVGQATDERSRWGVGKGMDLEGSNKEILRLLLRADVPIPPELLTPVAGYHTIQNRNAQLRNLMLKHEALMDDEDIEDNPELQRAKALQEARKKADEDIAKKEMDALKSGDISELKKTYGSKHTKIRQIKQIMAQAKKEEKRIETGRKYKKRHKDNVSSLALLKKKKKELSASKSMALNDFKHALNNANNGTKKGHSRKRSNSHHIVDIKFMRLNKKTQKRPSSATNRTSKPMDFGTNEDTNKRNKKHKKKKIKTPNTDKPKKRVSFAEATEPKKKKKRVSFVLPDDDDNANSMHTPKNPMLLNNSSNVSDGTVILHSGATPKYSDEFFLTPESKPMSSFDDPTLLNIGSGDDIMSGHQQNYSMSKTVVIHSNQASFDESMEDSLSFDDTLDDAQWNLDVDKKDKNGQHDADIQLVIDSADELSSSESEITFSDDDDDDDDDDDGDAVPLSILRLREQEENEKKSVPLLPKVVSGVSYD